MTTGDWRTDRENLTTRMYATDEHLAVRYRIHEQYSRPVVDFQRWVLDTVQWSGDEWVLDVGSGPGAYFAGVAERTPHGRHVAGDLSFGMVRQACQSDAAPDFTVLNFDAQRLPFPDGTFHVVLANHMLYHVAALPGALAEIRRVLRPDGVLIAGTNSRDNMPELDTLARRACALLGCPLPPSNADSRFSLESGPGLLAHYFRAVARYDLPGAFHFPEVDPVLDYVNSMRAAHEPQLPEDVSWAEFLGVMEKQVARLIRHFGELKVHKLAGVIIATNGGGFAREYLARLDTSH
ncbi:MAG: class I SAM-dependent methyltransferase [Chloroflexi bacterium]|nr:class I SAM-dependent methyltransferase [Chloroflexota bacterium]